MKKNKPKTGYHEPKTHLLKGITPKYGSSLELFQQAYSRTIPRNHESEDLSSALSRAKGNAPLWNSIKRTRDALSHEIFGTYEPSFRLQSAPYAISTSAGGILTYYFSLSLGIMANYSVLVDMFDEYQFAGPFEIMFRPSLKPGNFTSYNMFVGVLDYTDNTALSSTVSALSYDTAQIVVADPYLPNVKPQDPCSGTVTWNGHVQGQPDMVWQSTTSTVTVAYLKTYNFSPSLPSSTTLGYVNAHALIKFRQLANG